MEDSIYKGKIQIGQEREYKEVDTINVDYLDVVDEISLRATESKILSENQELQANIIYKESRIRINFLYLEESKKLMKMDIL